MKYGLENGHQLLMSVHIGLEDSMMPTLKTSFLANLSNVLILTCLKTLLIQILIEQQNIWGLMDHGTKIKLVFILETVVLTQIYQVTKKYKNQHNVQLNQLINTIIHHSSGQLEMKLNQDGAIFNHGIKLGLIPLLFRYHNHQMNKF